MLELRRHIGVAASAIALAGCGGDRGPPTPAPGSPEARLWADNAARLVQQLQQDVLMSATGGSNLASARRAIADQNTVYILLVAYGDFGSCTRELAAAGTPSRHQKAAVALIVSACRPLERSAALFVDAMKRSDARTLLAATSRAANAMPLLVRALAALRALR